MNRYEWLTPAVPAAIALFRCDPLMAALKRPPGNDDQIVFGLWRDASGQAVDEVVVRPTADGRWEVCSHGGPGIRAAVNAAMVSHGFEEEQVADDGLWTALARAPSPAARDWLMTHGLASPPFAPHWLQRTPIILLTGPANAGKSTLLNAWCGHQRALVSDVAGTTRDLVAAVTMCENWRIRLIDSAGLRPTDDHLERAGQDLVTAARQRADLVVHLWPADAAGEPQCELNDVQVCSKADLLEGGKHHQWLYWSGPDFSSKEQVAADLTALNRAILHALGLPAM